MTRHQELSFEGLREAYIQHRDKILGIIDQVLTTGVRLRSQEVELFEQQCAQAVQRKFAVAVSSGTDALHLALRALGVGSGDEVIVTAFSFLASASSILLAGAIPVFVDIEPSTLLMDLNQVKDAITDKTKAIVAVQLFGQCLHFPDLEALASHYGIPIVEDAAQAFGSYDGERPAGSLGAISTFSFDPAKVIPGVTTGGVICTDDEKLYRQAQLLHFHGYNPRTDDTELIGYNSQMSAINAAVLSWQLTLESLWRQKRYQVAAQYEHRLGDLLGIKTLPSIHAAGNNYHKYVIQIPRRWYLMVQLRRAGIPFKIHYPRPIPRYSSFKDQGRCLNELPVSVAVSNRILSLPIHPFLLPDQIEFIIATIENILQSSLHQVEQ